MKKIFAALCVPSDTAFQELLSKNTEVDCLPYPFSVMKRAYKTLRSTVVPYRVDKNIVSPVREYCK